MVFLVLLCYIIILYESVLIRIVNVVYTGSGEHTVQVCIEKGKILEISGLWKQQVDSNVKNWKTNHWWEHGFVRRIELPENADWKKIEVILKNDLILEIKIPVKSSPTPSHQGGDSE